MKTHLLLQDVTCYQRLTSFQGMMRDNITYAQDQNREQNQREHDFQGLS